jgi:hypothetical protein
VKQKPGVFESPEAEGTLQKDDDDGGREREEVLKRGKTT